MSPRTLWKVKINSSGELVLPKEAAVQFGLIPGASTQLEIDGGELRILRPVSQLARLYVEPTNFCNFECRTCMRNVWDEPAGFMSADTFARVLEGIKQFDRPPLVFFGGFGEPLTHPHILDMVRLVHEAGAEVELITNAYLLSRDISAGLQEAGLSRLWVSLDGATPESFADIRVGEALPQILENLQNLWIDRHFMNYVKPNLGIAFVAMKRNIAELPALVRLGKQLGADRFSISNVLAHTPELKDEVLYSKCMYEIDLPVSEWGPLLEFPRMDVTPATRDAAAGALQNWNHLAIARQHIRFGFQTCPFVHKGSTSIRWDGKVSPCLSLLHTHTSFLDDHQRRSIAFLVGDLHDQSLREIWECEPYLKLRERLQIFDFSPCVFCNSCEMAEQNQEDCFGNTAPACGGCLWAQGIIQCP